MISPTVGRVVWFYRYVTGQGHKGPLAAHVACVHSESMVTLMVIDEGGNPRPQGSVLLLQDDQPAPGYDYCTWMPYQKGQAAKTEAVETELSAQKSYNYSKT
jgi:hypothetical protein